MDVSVEFPSGKFRLARPNGWSLLTRNASDEWGRHTTIVSIPFVRSLVVVKGNCPRTGDCADMEVFACEFPGCPYLGSTSVPDQKTYCMTHDEEFYREWIEEEEANKLGESASTGEKFD